MKTSFLLMITAILGLFFNQQLSAQNCKFFVPTEKGTKLEYTMFDRNGREQAKQTQTISDVKQQSGKTIAVVEASAVPKRGSEEAKPTTFELKCEGGKFFMNMEPFVSSFNYQQYQNLPGSEVTIQSDDLYYPSDMAVGSKLPDGNLEVTVNINEIPMINAKISIVNRKVEKKESITSSAGTFECLKVTSEIVTTTSFSDGAKTKVIQWVAEGVGVVKSESLMDDGKLISYELLTKIEK
jgi:hypothetical protein